MRIGNILVLGALSLSAPLAAQTTKPVVHVIATGGTISNTGQGDALRLTGDALVKSLPGIEDIATVTVEQFTNVASGSITQANWRALANHINELYATRPDLTGVVVTHGTDTLEETAYFLDLTVGSCHPVVVTGAMRQATAIGAEGPGNLYDAIVTAAAPNAAGRGTMVLMNDDVFAARDVSKMHTTHLNAFDSPIRGTLGSVTGSRPVFFRMADRTNCQVPAFDLATLGEFPRVDVIYTYIGADSIPIQAVVSAGAKGIVTAGAGNGATVITQSAALRAARAAGVYVLGVSRTGSGIVGNAGDLNAQKARILLMLALAKTTVTAEVTALVQRLSASF